MPIEPQVRRSSQSAELSDAIVRIVREFTGRGPLRARTTVDRDAVFVVMHDSLTKGEQTLVHHGQEDEVLALRRTYQEAMRTAMTAAIERIVGRRVVSFMSANSADPDCAVEIFLLEDVAASAEKGA